MTQPGALKKGKFIMGYRRLASVAIKAVVAVLASALSTGLVASPSAIQAASPELRDEGPMAQGLLDSRDEAGRDRVVTRVLAKGAPFHSTNGVNFDAEDRLYVASVLGSGISVMDPRSGRVTERLGPGQGVIVPDDLAFGPDGSLYWTGLFTGEVGRLTPEGEKSTVAVLVPGANAITFSDDGRLFVAQCFFGDGLYEVDPEGVDGPRLISDQLGPGCGLNAMDWGPDGRLYGPRWFRGEVVSVDVDSGDVDRVVDGVGVPAAVKFDSHGRLHVIDTQSGRLWRVDTSTGEKELVAAMAAGLDNMAFDSDDRLFVSSYADSFIARVLPNGDTRMVSTGGMTSPGGVAVAPDSGDETVYVADFFSLRGFDGLSGRQRFIQRSVIGVSALGFPLTVSTDGDNLLLTSWPDNLVQVLNPKTGEIVESHADFATPLNAVRFQGDLVVAELGAGRVVRASSGDPSARTPLVEGLGVPAGLAATDEDVWISDWAAGSVLQIVASGEVLEEPILVAGGLTLPEGMAVGPDGGLLVVESGAGRLSKIHLPTGEVSTVAEGLALGAQAPPNAPPTWVFNGVAAGPSGSIYVTGDIANVLYRITRADDVAN